MRNHKEAKVIGGRFKGETFLVEGTIEEMNAHRPVFERCLPYLATFGGNWAARNAMEIDKYTIDDAPFYYGKIGALGYIISEKDIKFVEKKK